MNSNTVILKGITDVPIRGYFTGYRFIHNNFFSILCYDYLDDLMLEFDRLSGRYDYHEWFDIPETDHDFFAGYKPKIDIRNKDVVAKIKPMSYLGFAERLHWMLQTSFNFYSVEHLSQDDTINLIRDVSSFMFGDENWKIGDDPQSYRSLPNWVDHDWEFFDVVPDFLTTSGYFEHIEKTKFEGYFDAGPNDSCLMAFHDRVFYIILTNGSP